MKAIEKPKRLGKGKSEKKTPLYFLSNMYLKVRDLWAKKMTKATIHFSRKTWIIVLALYLILSAALCTYIILSGLNNTGKQLFK